MNSDTIDFMGTHWLQIEDNTITIGINSDSLEEIDEIEKANLPAEGESFEADDICGELETSDGPINIFAPVSGKVVEVNAAVIDSPALVKDDPLGEGWLFRLESDNDEELNEFLRGASEDH